MSIPHLLVHNKLDNVGVVVVEGVEAGTELLAVITEDNSDFTITTQQDILYYLFCIFYGTQIVLASTE